MPQYDTGRQHAQRVAEQLQEFRGALDCWLDAQIDWRLIRTFFLALQAIVRFWHSRSGLLLRASGGHVLPPSQALAETKLLPDFIGALSPAGPTPCRPGPSGFGQTKRSATVSKGRRPPYTSGTGACWRNRRALP